MVPVAADALRSIPGVSAARPAAVILAGGLGTRMLPLTAHRPKHLLEVGGVPFLEHQLARLGQVGADPVVLATSYRAEQFLPVLGDGGRWGLRLVYAEEPSPLGTGGALRHALGYLPAGADGTVLVLNGDVLSGHDLRAQLDRFGSPRDGRPVDACLHVLPVADPRPFGCVPTDPTGRVLAFLEKTDEPPTDQVNAGCYVFRRRLLEAVPEGRPVSLEREVLPAMVAAGRLLVSYAEPAYWRDVGTPAALVAASRDVVLGRAPSPAVRPSVTGAWVSPQARVAAARITDGSAVSAGAVVGDQAVVSGSVLMTGARVGAGAEVVDSVVGPCAVVRDRERLVAGVRVAG